MRLLDTSTLRLKEFSGNEIPGYAILSHRWEREEVTFQDLQDGSALGMAKYSKISGCCRQAAIDGWKWAWIDSCCIDKTSSSELSETINSMFKWYSNAKVCYVYLNDVGRSSGKDAASDPAKGFSRSKWFTRGWTLQELLAPRVVIFFNKNWVDIGTKESLKSELSSITGIRIQDFIKFRDVCVARKMSWASKRETTRIEDQAYCLMGLFGINMPTLYGEGNNAFLRLQLEILSSTDDESIFAWERSGHDEEESVKKLKIGEEKIYTTKGEVGRGSRGGLLANSPADFHNCGDARLAPIPGVPYMERSPYSMTNKGIRMEHLLIPFPLDSKENVTDPGRNEFPTSPLLIPGEHTGVPEHQFLSLLHCKFEGNLGNIAIPIFQGWGSQPAERITDKLHHILGKKEFTKRTLYIKQHRENSQESAQSISDSATLFLSGSDPGDYEFIVTDFWASWPSGILMRRPGGGFRLSDIPSPTKELKAIIGVACPNLKLEFVIFLDWSNGPRAQVRLKDPRVYIDRMASQFNVKSSSERISKSLTDGIVVTIVSVTISPAFIDNEDVYRMDVKIDPPNSHLKDRRVSDAKIDLPSSHPKDRRIPVAKIDLSSSHSKTRRVLDAKQIGSPTMGRSTGKAQAVKQSDSLPQKTWAGSTSSILGPPLTDFPWLHGGKVGGTARRAKSTDLTWDRAEFSTAKTVEKRPSVAEIEKWKSTIS
ncbi:heterokaryon incompatibility protein-domain-containing protein [Tricladium varicosporioides]|nr:heterokaryon incompatibility protein-domain-containing protein [Hymenoscyphus varicosporioides]